jgi:anti-sigma factor RsiW
MTELSCRDVLEFLADYVAHELAPAPRRAFEEHLAECDACVAYLRSYEQAVRLGTAAFDDLEETADPEVVQRLVEAVLAARRQS